MSARWALLEPGAALEYRLRRAQGEWVMRLEVLEAREDAGVTRARLRRTWTGPDAPGGGEETVEIRRDGVYRDGALELPLPAAAGARWALPPREYRVEAVGAPAVVPAGRFEGCARVSYLIAGGDAGSGEALYAPGVGLVHERCSDESDPYETVLTAVRRPA